MRYGWRRSWVGNLPEAGMEWPGPVLVGCKPGHVGGRPNPSGRMGETPDRQPREARHAACQNVIVADGRPSRHGRRLPHPGGTSASICAMCEGRGWFRTGRRWTQVHGDAGRKEPMKRRRLGARAYNPKSFPHPVGRVPSRGVMNAPPPCSFGQSGSGILPLDAIQPEPGRLCHLSAGDVGKGMKGASRMCGTPSQGMKRASPLGPRPSPAAPPCAFN